MEWCSGDFEKKCEELMVEINLKDIGKEEQTYNEMRYMAKRILLLQIKLIFCPLDSLTSSRYFFFSFSWVIDAA